MGERDKTTTSLCCPIFLPDILLQWKAERHSFPDDPIIPLKTPCFPKTNAAVLVVSSLGALSRLLRNAPEKVETVKEAEKIMICHH